MPEKLIRKINAGALIGEIQKEADIERARMRKLYTAEMLHLAKTIRAMVVTLDTFSIVTAKHAETLVKYRQDESELIQTANAMQEIGAALQREATRIEKKSKFPPQ